MVWPAGLAAFYPYPHNGLLAREVVLAGTLLAGLSAVALGRRRKQPWLLVGWLWYLVMLLPVVGVIQVGGQAHADRYTYLPQIGISVAITWLVAEWRLNRVALGGLMAGVLALFMVCAWQQTAYWQNGETLWTHTLACTTDNNIAQDNLGVILAQKGRMDAAITCFQQALQIEPDFAEAHNNLGNALLQMGKVDAAITHCQRALQISPEDAQARLNLGNALFRKGGVGDAITQYRKALQIDPAFAMAHNNLGTVLRQEGRVDEAITEYQKALQIKPNEAEFHNNLGKALQQKGRVGEAISQYREALQIQPDNPGIQNNLAWLLATCSEASLRNGSMALELARRANALTGGENPAILRTLAAAFAEAGRFPEAMETAQRALRLAGAQSNTGLAGALQSEMKLYKAGLPLHQ
jgi:tetratricopeptide (TPR) repeat protein